MLQSYFHPYMKREKKKEKKKMSLIREDTSQKKTRQYLMGENIHGLSQALLSPTSVVLCIIPP